MRNRRRQTLIFIVRGLSHFGYRDAFVIQPPLIWGVGTPSEGLPCADTGAQDGLVSLWGNNLLGEFERGK